MERRAPLRECHHDNPSREFLQLFMTNIPLFFPVSAGEAQPGKPAM
jgi:hypothetical protein